MEHVLVLGKHALSSVLHSGLRPFPSATSTYSPLPLPISGRAVRLPKPVHASPPLRSVHLLGLRRKLCSLGVGSNAAGTRTCLTVTGTHISVISLRLPPSHRHCGFSKPRSQKHTHLTTQPHCVFFHLLGTGTSLIYLGVLSVFSCFIYPPLYLSLCFCIAKKK